MTTDNKLTQEQFGNINETSFYNLLKQNGISNITQTDKYSPYDFKIKLNNGEEIVIVQIAGLIARRIVCEVEQGQELKQGDRIGMIRFGSRVDIYFKNKKVLAKLGQNVVAGESLIASD